MRICREGIAVLGLALVIGSIGFYWPQLPPTIPTHFGASGPPNGFGSRGSIWTLAMVATLLYAGLTLAGRYPDAANYPSWVTPEQRVQLRPLTVATVGWLKAEVMAIFAWLTWTTISVARGRSTGLSAAFLPVSMAAVGATLGVMMVQMRRIKTAGTRAG